MLDRFKIVIVLLFMVTMLWAVLFFQSVIEFNTLFKYGELPYQAWNKGQVMLLGGLVLLCLWMVIAVRRKNIFIGVAVLGMIIAPTFLFLARIEDIGYTEEAFSGVDGGGFYVTLNPLLHLGDGVYSYREPISIAIKSSMKVENLLLYSFYGELASFSLFGFFISIRKFISTRTHA